MGQEQSADGTEPELLNFGKNSPEEIKALLADFTAREKAKMITEYKRKRDESIKDN